MMNCTWPNGTCACYVKNAQKPDPYGRVWMHCEEGLGLSKTSMARFVMHCLTNNIEIGDIYVFDYRYHNSRVSASVRLRPEQFEEFERETKGKLRKPQLMSLNSSSAEHVEREDIQ